MTTAARVALHMVVYTACVMAALWIALECEMWVSTRYGFAQFGLSAAFLIGFWTYPITAFVNVVFRRK